MSRRKAMIVAVAGVAVAAAGGAVAATRLDSPSARSQAIIDDAAGRLNIAPSTLSAALRKAIDDQIDAAVKAGELTQAQADALKQRVASGDYPLVPGFGLFRDRGLGVFPFPGALFGSLQAAASYLGVTVDELRSDLSSGKTLAQVTTAKGKTVGGLVDAMVSDAEKRLDAAVAAGRLTKAQEQAIESNLEDRITNLVNGVRPPMALGPRNLPYRGPFFRFGPRHGGPFGGFGAPAAPRAPA